MSRAFVRGLTFRVAYTYSKDLDNASEVFNTFNSPTSYQADLSPTGLAREWGNSAWDHRNYLVVSYVWAPKGYTSGSTFANAALGVLTRHWTVSGIERFQSGPYSTLNVSGFDTNGDGSTANDRPVVSNPNAPFNTVAIDTTLLATKTVPGVQGTYYNGNLYNTTKQKVLIDPSTVHFIVQRGQNFLLQEVGRDTFLQPGYQQHDIALEKGVEVPHFERGQLTLRAEANNVGNHNPVISRTGAGRSLVLWALFKF